MRWRRSLRGVNVTDLLLFVIIVCLVCVLLSRHTRQTSSQTSQSDEIDSDKYVKDIGTNDVDGRIKRDVPDAERNKDDNADDDFLTRDKINAVPDTRPRGCPASYPRALEHSVTIIMHFYDYQFYDVKTTYRSLRHNTPDEMIKEILLVDAGSTIQYIRNDAEHFAKTSRKVRLLRTDIRESPIRARHYAADQAAGSVLVFLDSNALCNQGWLEPLVDAIDKDPSTISVPHFDFVEDLALNVYKRVPQKIVHVFSWDLTSHVMKLGQNEAGVTPYETPVIRPSVFAIQSAYYKTIGELDEEFSQPGGEMLEFSMRAWMCGAKLQVIPCSRVGLVDLYDSLVVQSKHNVARLMNFWFDQSHADLINHFRKVDVELNTEQKNGILIRKGVLRDLNCKNAAWYLKRFSHLIAAPQDVKSIVSGESQFGYLKSESGSCAGVGNDSVIELDGCPDNTYQRDMIFEYDANTGQLRVQGKCVTLERNYDVIAKPCTLGTRKQIWKMTSLGELRMGAHSIDCATHVSDPRGGKKNKRQIIMLQKCTSNNKTFNRFKFII